MSTEENACANPPLPFSWFYECPSASESVQRAQNQQNRQPAAKRDRSEATSPRWSDAIDEPCTSQLDRGGCPKTAPLFPAAGAQCQKPKRPIPFVTKYPLVKSLRSLAFILLCECYFLIALNTVLL